MEVQSEVLRPLAITWLVAIVWCGRAVEKVGMQGPRRIQFVHAHIGGSEGGGRSVLQAAVLWTTSSAKKAVLREVDWVRPHEVWTHLYYERIRLLSIALSRCDHRPAGLQFARL